MDATLATVTELLASPAEHDRLGRWGIDETVETLHVVVADDREGNEDR